MYYQKIKNKEMLYFTPSSSSLGFSFASKQTIEDVIKFSSEIGFGLVVLGKKVKIPMNIIGYYLKEIKNWKKADIVLATYPYICRPTKDNFLRIWESNLIEKLNKDKFSILHIIDLPIEQNTANGKKVDGKAYKVEKQIFESFDVLLVFNKWMRKNIEEKYDISDKKFVEFEILDYGVSYEPKKRKKISKPVRIIYSGELKSTQSTWVKKIPHTKDITYEFSGPKGQWINELGKKNVLYRGLIPKQKFFDFLSQYHFGLIYKEFNRINYYEFGATSKFSAYMTAGLPLLCPSRFFYLSNLIDKYGIGFSFDCIEEILEEVDNITEEDYNMARENCIKLGRKIQRGYFFKKAVCTALCSEHTK